VTQRSRVRFPPGPLLSNKHEQVIYTRDAQANSTYHPSGVGKRVVGLILAIEIVIFAREHCVVNN